MLRQREDRFDQLVVHKRHANFERMGHRKAVAEREDVIREERRVVEVQPRGETRDLTLRREHVPEAGTRGCS